MYGGRLVEEQDQAFQVMPSGSGQRITITITEFTAE
jgi:hypothetical protein